MSSGRKDFLGSSELFLHRLIAASRSATDFSRESVLRAALEGGDKILELPFLLFELPVAALVSLRTFVARCLLRLPRDGVIYVRDVGCSSSFGASQESSAPQPSCEWSTDWGKPPSPRSKNGGTQSEDSPFPR